MGSTTVVGLNTNRSIKLLKGPSRPVQDEMGRALVLASLNCVDAVVIFDEETPVELIRSLRPNLLVKGGEYKPEQVVGADLVEGWGGKLLLVDMIPAGAPRKQYPAFAVKGKTAIPKPCS